MPTAAWFPICPPDSPGSSADRVSGYRSRLLILAAAAVLGLAGCGSEDTTGTTEPASTTPPTATPATETTEHGGFAHCLNEHGVTESTVSPVGPPPGVDPGTWDKAVQACSSLAPGPGPAPGP